ncbi:hypothetical protein DPM18_08175 [Polynucleobacter paneuropaeus]|uniref:hypothetical protein n=1 Tax=Polynucleobacter paneuropaeus TaxID=2527775 RepID=UPI000DBF270E|nr:hypothetical protein [Polynucleobacter paneuropaeus]AWW46788.1 hypothetical protein DPM18_08175 [Polynucleobacter paneuropaeus]
MKKFTLLIFLLTISITSFGGLFDNKLQFYMCPKESLIYSCDKCQIEKGSFGEFKVDKSTSTVMFIYYDGNKIIGSGTYDNCKVIDEKNWTCSYSGLSQNSHQRMINGSYSSTFEYQTQKPWLKDSFSCGK